MQMTLDEFAARFPDRGRRIPAEYAGQRIAWNDEESEIVAHDTDFHEVSQQATHWDCAKPVLQRIPRGPEGNHAGTERQMPLVSIPPACITKR